MTPLEKAKADEGRVNYCDECEQFEIVGNAAYCKVDGKLIHPIMMMRGQGTGPAWNCQKMKKTKTNYDRLLGMNIEQMAAYLADHPLICPYNPNNEYHKAWLDWLKQEATDG